MPSNRVLKEYVRGAGLIRLGQHYFSPEWTLIRQEQLRVFQGYFTSIQPSVRGLMLTVNPVHRIMHHRSVRDMLEDISADVYERYTRAHFLGVSLTDRGV